jgi:hypothetical protein
LCVGAESFTSIVDYIPRRTSSDIRLGYSRGGEKGKKVERAMLHFILETHTTRVPVLSLLKMYN